MINFLDLLKTVYSKEKLAVIDDMSDCIAITKTLAKDTDNLKALREVTKYLFLISPRSYFYLLFCHIPKKAYFKLIKIDKEEEKENKLFNKIKQILQWSDKELLYNKKIIEYITIGKEKEWKANLGL